MPKGNFGKRNFLLEVYRYLDKIDLLTPDVEAMIDTIVRTHERDQLHDVFKYLYGLIRRTIENTEEPYKALKLNNLLDDFKYPSKANLIKENK
jgi:hypothetical protein